MKTTCFPSTNTYNKIVGYVGTSARGKAGFWTVNIILMRMQGTSLRIGFILLLPVILLSCTKEPVNPVPDVAVNFQVNLDMPDASNLKNPLSSILVSNYGYRRHGVILYNSGVDGYYAYDATCPNDLDQAVVLNDSTPLVVTCPKCNRVYSLMAYGYPKSGGGYALKKYTVSPSGSVLFVYNGY